MKLGGKTALFLAATFSCAIAAKAVVNDGNPYHPIVDRNVFGLKDPPPPPTNEPPPPPPATIKIAGLTDILGRKQAILEWQEGAGAAGKKNSSVFTEGQREGQIEVLSIDVMGGIVKVKNNGVAQSLTTEQNAVKPASTPFTPPPAAGGIPSPTASIPAPSAVASTYSGGSGVLNVNPSANTSAAANPGMKQIPSRQLRLPTAATTTTATTPAATQTATPQPQLTVDEQIILLEVEAEVNKDNPAHPPVPPTPANPGRNATPPPAPPGLPAVPK